LRPGEVHDLGVPEVDEVLHRHRDPRRVVGGDRWDVGISAAPVDQHHRRRRRRQLVEKGVFQMRGREHEAFDIALT
jgi:hypothetical protein